jgi:hypothetical protein
VRFSAESAVHDDEQTRLAMEDRRTFLALAAALLHSAIPVYRASRVEGGVYAGT